MEINNNRRNKKQYRLPYSFATNFVFANVTQKRVDQDVRRKNINVTLDHVY